MISKARLQQLAQQKLDSMCLDEHIVKTSSGYRLVSKKTGKNLGDFTSLAAAKKHEREVQFFKHKE